MGRACDSWRLFLSCGRVKGFMLLESNYFLGASSLVLSCQNLKQGNGQSQLLPISAHWVLFLYFWACMEFLAAPYGQSLWFLKIVPFLWSVSCGRVKGFMLLESNYFFRASSLVLLWQNLKQQKRSESSFFLSFYLTSIPGQERSIWR
jgi:hypothetical protein